MNGADISTRFENGNAIVAIENSHENGEWYELELPVHVPNLENGDAEEVWLDSLHLGLYDAQEEGGLLPVIGKLSSLELRSHKHIDYGRFIDGMHEANGDTETWMYSGAGIKITLSVHESRRAIANILFSQLAETGDRSDNLSKIALFIGLLEYDWLCEPNGGVP